MGFYHQQGSSVARKRESQKIVCLRGKEKETNPNGGADPQQQNQKLSRQSKEGKNPEERREGLPNPGKSCEKSRGDSASKKRNVRLWLKKLPSFVETQRGKKAVLKAKNPGRTGRGTPLIQ